MFLTSAKVLAQFEAVTPAPCTPDSIIQPPTYALGTLSEAEDKNDHDETSRMEPFGPIEPPGTVTLAKVISTVVPV
jgi:hypothetical protein